MFIRWIIADPERPRKYRIEIPLIWSIGGFICELLDRDYNLLPLMDGASLRTILGIALLKFNPPDGELILTRRRGVVLYDWRAIG